MIAKTSIDWVIEVSIDVLLMIAIEWMNQLIHLICCYLKDLVDLSCNHQIISEHCPDPRLNYLHIYLGLLSHTGNPSNLITLKPKHLYHFHFTRFIKFLILLFTRYSSLIQMLGSVLKSYISKVLYILVSYIYVLLI